MCTIVFAYRCHPRYRLIVAANRDEFYSRPSAPAGFWPDCPEVLAGRDLKDQGTWMGITRNGRFAALTNYRDPAQQQAAAVSRGGLVSGFLCGSQTPAQYLTEAAAKAERYNGFNLLVGDTETLWYYSNRQQEICEVAPGVHGLSNHLLDTPWPKVAKAQRTMLEQLAQPEISENALWQLLADSEKAPENELPDTGVGLELERLLSSVFIESPEYGTRASTILLAGYDGQTRLVERAYDQVQRKWNESIYVFQTPI